MRAPQFDLPDEIAKYQGALTTAPIFLTAVTTYAISSARLKSAR
jgi:hypothetical protein